MSCCRLALPVPVLLLLIACAPGPADLEGDPDGSVGPGACGPSNTVVLAVGEVAEFRGSSARLFCVRARSAGEEYAIATSAGTTGTTSFTIRSRATSPITGPPLPVATRDADVPAFDMASGPGSPLPDDRFHTALREREERELSPLLRGSTGGPAVSPNPAAAGAPSEGAVLTLNAQSQGACENPIRIEGRVEAVSDRAIVVADLVNPAGGFTPQEYRHLAITFDTLIAPLAEENFGVPSDIDGNGRTILLFTREVNRLTARDSDRFTAGFFFSRDLFPRQAAPGSRFGSCAHSNEGEILYLLVPDPAGSVNGNVQEKSFVDRIMPATLIHEYQHLINASRRLHVHQWSPSHGWSEEVWLNEALSHTAEELLFYRTSGLAPGMNIGPQTLQQAPGSRAVVAMNRHQVFNLLRFHEFLASPESTSPFGQQDGLATRGASWSFLRYIVDRRGGSAAEFYHGLVNSPQRGLANLAGTIGGTDTFYRWLADWTVAIYADERVPGLEPRHRDRSWRHPALHSSLMPGRPYPLRTGSLVDGTPDTETLAGGGAAYFRFGVEGGRTARLEITSGSGDPPGSLTAVLLRTR